MGEQHKTKSEYVKQYARDYCDNDCDVAETHEIVKEVCEELNEE